MVSIRERLARAEGRAVPGHWEGDLLAGSNRTHIATLVERKSRFVMLVKVPSSETQVVVKAVTRRIRRLPKPLRRSLTWDRGKEMSSHKDFSLATDVKVYFCEPQSPWQRGSNENPNGLLRQYFPRGADLPSQSQADLDYHNPIANSPRGVCRMTLASASARTSAAASREATGAAKMMGAAPAFRAARTAASMVEPVASPSSRRITVFFRSSSAGRPCR